MGDRSDRGVPGQVQDLAKKTGQDLLANPDQLPGPLGTVITAAKKLPGRIADDLSPGHKDTPPATGDGTPGSGKRPGAPTVTVRPDFDPHVTMSGGRPDVRGSGAGGHVTVSGREGSVSYSATARTTGGLGPAGGIEMKSGIEAGVSVQGGPDGKGHYSAGVRVAGTHRVDVVGGAVHNVETARAGFHGEVEVAKGVKATADLSVGVDVGGPHGPQAVPGFGGFVGLKFTPGAPAKSPGGTDYREPLPGDDPVMRSVRAGQAKQAGDDKFLDDYVVAQATKGLGLGRAPYAVPGAGDTPASSGLSPAQTLVAKMNHDRYLTQNAETPAERKLAGERLAAEDKVLHAHPEWGNPQVRTDSTGTSPGDYRAYGKDGVSYSGEAVKLPDTLQREVQSQMQSQVRTAGQEQAQDRERSRGLERPAEGPSR